MEQLEIVEGLIQEKPQVSPVSPADYVTRQKVRSIMAMP